MFIVGGMMKIQMLPSSHRFGS